MPVLFFRDEGGPLWVLLLVGVPERGILRLLLGLEVSAGSRLFRGLTSSVGIGFSGKGEPSSSLRTLRNAGPNR